MPRQLELSLVVAREIDPPAGQHAAHCRLLTSHEVKDLAAARRWAIEQLFRTLKTKGFDVEALRIAEDGPRGRLIMAALVAAVTVLQLVHGRDGTPPGQAPRALTEAFEPEDRPALEALSAELGGNTERQKNPHPQALWRSPPGSARAWAAGQATTENQAPSSCSRAGRRSRPSKRDGILPNRTLCASSRP